MPRIRQCARARDDRPDARRRVTARSSSRVEGPFAARGARELVQSASALRLDPLAVRALASELREAEARTAALFGISS